MIKWPFSWPCPLVPLGAGATLALATFIDLWWLQLLTLVCIAPVFVFLRKMSASHRYITGLWFFGAWLIPTTYWYYSFMPSWLALLASFGFVTLIANVFRLFSLGKKNEIPFAAALALVTVVWSAFTFARMHLPIVEDWWLPHLGYAIWKNSGILQLSAFGGEATAEFTVLLINAALSLIAVRYKIWVAGVVAGLIVIAVALTNLLVWNAESDPVPQTVALQQMTTGGVDIPATQQDIALLTQISAQALAGMSADKPRVVVWPENSIPENLQPLVQSATRELDAALVFHSVEMRGVKRYKRVIMLDEMGVEVLRNSKIHIAPDEIGVGDFSHEMTAWGGWKVTAYVCYDMHYPDSVTRVAGADVVFVPINDAAYGALQQRFHTADLAFRAVQTSASIISASTNGPTVHIDQHGVVRQQLSHGVDGVLTVVD